MSTYSPPIAVRFGTARSPSHHSQLPPRLLFLNTFGCLQFRFGQCMQSRHLNLQTPSRSELDNHRVMNHRTIYVRTVSLSYLSRQTLNPAKEAIVESRVMISYLVHAKYTYIGTIFGSTNLTWWNPVFLRLISERSFTQLTHEHFGNYKFTPEK